MGTFLLMRAGGWSVAVSREHVIRTEPSGNVHFIPMSPQFFAGVGVNVNSVSNLYDLWAALGYPAYERSTPGNVLVMEDGDRPEGFACAGVPEELELDDAEMLALPSS